MYAGDSEKSSPCEARKRTERVERASGGRFQREMEATQAVEQSD